MKNIFKSFLVILISGNFVWGQVINFTDLELKEYLINELCVDTTQNGVSFSNDRGADTNGDNEIQLTEALSIKALELNDFNDIYMIQTLSDLNQFSNLKYLKLIDLDSVERISNFTLDSLRSLWISDGVSLRIIDISNLPNLTTTLRIEGITTLDSLNIRNGTSASQFSLFYSQDIKHACIDSIPAEVDEFTNSGAMLNGVFPNFNCETLGINEKENFNSHIRIFPNPAHEYFEVKSNYSDIEIWVLNSLGKSLIQTKESTVDISMLSAGVYFLRIREGETLLTQKIVVQ